MGAPVEIDVNFGNVSEDVTLSAGLAGDVSMNQFNCYASSVTINTSMAGTVCVDEYTITGVSISGTVQYYNDGAAVGGTDSYDGSSAGIVVSGGTITITGAISKATN